MLQTGVRISFAAGGKEEFWFRRFYTWSIALHRNGIKNFCNG